jgi:hypothetical protein
MATKLALIPMKTRVADIQSVYESAAKRIIATLSSLEPDTYTSAKSGDVLSKIRSIIGQLDTAVQLWAPGAIRAAYDESAGVARTRLEMIGAKQSKRYDPARHDKKIGALTKTVMTDYWKANRTIEKTARKYLASVSQAGARLAKIQEMQAFTSAEVKKMIDDVVIDATSKNLARGAVDRLIRERLLSMIEGGDFININGRSFNLRSYAELVARTRMREASTEASIEQNKQYGNDLVEIPKHENPCDVCDEYVGNIYSISGDSPDYPLLPDGGPPFHPNCLCYLNSVSENALAWRNA